ncbi:MAG: hypothetical protein OEZ04_02905 [Nitrospinota bacterium]|nr:hypothetical protein [Nitrospinota bacterium]
MEKKSNDTQARWPQDDTAIALIGIPATLITAGVCLVIIGISTYPPLDGLRMLRMALFYGGSVAAVYIVFGLYLLRRKGSGTKAMVTFFVISLCGVPAATFGSVITANGALDTAPPNVLGAIVMDKQIDNHSGAALLGATHAIYVRSWRATGQRERLVVEKDVYETVTPFADTMIVTTKSGWFGFEWVVSVDIMPGAQSQNAGK